MYKFGYGIDIWLGIVFDYRGLCREKNIDIKEGILEEK